MPEQTLAAEQAPAPTAPSWEAAQAAAVAGALGSSSGHGGAALPPEQATQALMFSCHLPIIKMKSTWDATVSATHHRCGTSNAAEQ